MAQGLGEKFCAGSREEERFLGGKKESVYVLKDELAGNGRSGVEGARKEECVRVESLEVGAGGQRRVRSRTVKGQCVVDRSAIKGRCSVVWRRRDDIDAEWQ